jgi:hypothetical protein
VTRDERYARTGRLRIALLALPLVVLVGLVVLLDPLDLRGHRELARALVERGRTAIVGGDRFSGLSADGATLIAALAVPGLERALAGRDDAALATVLRRASIQHVLVDPTAPRAGDSLAARLSRYEPLAGLRGVYLSPRAALYALDPFDALPREQRDALAVVARRMLGGARPPRLQSFPEALRRVQPVEVMVLLRERGKARLWRSARGSSLARALLTAVEVARERWHEREQAMGGPLEPILHAFAVEIALLIDDGTVASADPAFVDRVFFQVHGVGYERKGSWRYMLPEATLEAGRGRASRAYRKLFTDDGLPQDSLARHELRLYRLRVQTLAVSSPEPKPDDGLGAPRTPDELLAAPGAH